MDDLDELVGAVAVAVGVVDEVACLLDDGAVFGCAGDGDAAAAAEYGAAESEIPGVAVRTPAAESLSAGLVCCDVPAGSDPRAFVDPLLAQHGVVASLIPVRNPLPEVGPSIANSEEGGRPRWRASGR